MEDKILVIGQAPPAVTQKYPYDTTMLYRWFEDVGIDIEKAQELFEFDAVVDKFPGSNKNGHVKPSKEQIDAYWTSTLGEKFRKASRVILLGNVALETICRLSRLFIERKYQMNSIRGKSIVFLFHPSYRNANLYKKNKASVKSALTDILKKGV